MSQLTVRLEAAGEEIIIGNIVRTAFGDERTPRLLQALRYSSAWRGLSFVAESDGVPVAHVSFTRGWLDTPSQLIEVLILSPMSVIPEFQRQGLGSRLITESLELLGERPEPLVFLEGDPRFYSRLGFLPGGEAGFLRPSLRIPERAFQFVKLPQYQPWMTGTLVYPDIFWEFDCVGLRGQRA